MPIYEYRCASGHQFEVVHRMTDDPVRSCEVCGEPVERIFRPVAVHFKGSGFYTTDYARSSAGDGKKADTNSGGDGKDAKPAEGSKAPSGSKASSESAGSGGKSAAASGD